ncbi:MAG: hypothetical protein RTU92_12440 [Candidatus Thorarchaeota archaeon]
MSKHSCPNCDGPLDVSQQRSTVVCLYCGTTVQIRTGEILKEHYLMRVQFNDDQAAGKMLSWAMKQLGAPKDLEEKAEIKESKLVFWPFWVVEVEAKADYHGYQNKPKFGNSDTAPRSGTERVPESGHLDMENDIPIPAGKNFPKALLHYIIPTKRKEYFDKDQVLEVSGAVEQAIIERDAATEKAKRIMSDKLQAEARKEVDKISKMDGKFKVPAVFLVHIPIWHIKYNYSVRNYEALIDGASGRVISMKFPRKVAFRAMTMLGGLTHLVAGGGIGLLLVYLGLFVFFDPIFPTLFGIIFGLGMLGFSLRFFGKAVSLGAEEEGAE